jgi:transcriptional regulator GlxA family with amidase domain
MDARVVDDGDVLTAGGITSGIDLALHLVRRWYGADVADRIADDLEYDADSTDVLVAREADQ